MTVTEKGCLELFDKFLDGGGGEIYIPRDKTFLVAINELNQITIRTARSAPGGSETR